MKIIDAHFHLGEDAYFDAIAKAAGHENNTEHLEEQYRARGFVHGIVMGNQPLADVSPAYPAFVSYCAGIDSREGFDRASIRHQAALLEKHFQNPNCVGLKLYPGYNYFYIYEDSLRPFYELAEKYDKPVAVHMGLTATDNALLKYSHPMVMDEAATRFRKVNFVMCHFGEPWFEDAAAVMEKNPNVTADLSGILEGKIPDFPAFLQKKHFYIERMKGWLEYLDCYERFMFGTDWPLANLGDYVEFTKAIIPAKHWEAVFYENAVRIYRLKLTEKNGIRV